MRKKFKNLEYVDDGKKRRNRKKEIRKSKVRIFANFGKRDNISKAEVLKFLIEKGRLPKEAFGTIDLLRSFSFIDVDKAYSKKLIENVNGKKLKNRPVKLEISRK